ncbi:hypothetical protein UP10_14310 [Bradyrhizobium sp. LTSPM299]|uniref:hypothetical protein n=1 Tax=Bradyrhizobium sp. LTSPM299 TaxID=1619233 RepID=UPI0005C7FA7E|nr:hypothetical protein [Bradyrhizobium sp. LTSPM299]KJC59874.1 hypothetical protein UP10_14310 [Bradyrhizobium sp. LTSPM299]
MAPRGSFKNELAEYRRSLGPIGDDRQELLMVAVLDRWQEHTDVELIWVKITGAVPDLSAQSFIGGVLHVREQCDRLRHVLEKPPGLVADARTSAAKDDDADEYEVAALKRRMAKQMLDRANRLVGHKKVSAPRQQFMRETSRMVELNCGKHLDEVVAALTEIAFDSTTDIKAVRDARRAPKRRRDIRTPK